MLFLSFADFCSTFYFLVTLEGKYIYNLLTSYRSGEISSKRMGNSDVSNQRSGYGA
jgi:hypothetical protein